MRTKMIGSIAAVGIIGLLTGCVPTKKYHASQDALSRVRNDSSQLAQQVASLNGNVHDLQEKNSGLQQSLDAKSTDLANQQKTLGYYQDYFNQQQTAANQMSDQLKGALSQAGLGDEDVHEANNCVYVSLDEDKIFKKNTMVVTTSGKQALNSLAQTFKDRSDVNVFVSNGDSTGGQGSMTTTMTSPESGDMATAGTGETHHTIHHHHTTAHKSNTENGSSAGSGSSTGSSSTASNSTKGSTTSDDNAQPAVAHHKPHHHHPAGEGGMTYMSNTGAMHHDKAYTMKQGRMYAVATNFLQDGVSKVNLTLQPPGMNSGTPQNKIIKVIITPTMNDFNPPAKQ